MAKPLRIALTKGRLEKDTVELLERLGYDCTAVREKGRRLILPIPDGNMEVVLAKANDVITYVEHGVCDMGVVGKDTIIEMQGKFFELVDLGFGRCRFALACKKRNCPGKENGDHIDPVTFFLFSDTCCHIEKHNHIH